MIQLLQSAPVPTGEAASETARTAEGASTDGTARPFAEWLADTCRDHANGSGDQAPQQQEQQQEQTETPPAGIPCENMEDAIPADEELASSLVLFNGTIILDDQTIDNAQTTEDAPPVIAEGDVEAPPVVSTWAAPPRNDQPGIDSDSPPPTVPTQEMPNTPAPAPVIVPEADHAHPVTESAEAGATTLLPPADAVPVPPASTTSQPAPGPGPFDVTPPALPVTTANENLPASDLVATITPQTPFVPVSEPAAQPMPVSEPAVVPLPVTPPPAPVNATDVESATIQAPPPPPAPAQNAQAPVVPVADAPEHATPAPAPAVETIAQAVIAPPMPPPAPVQNGTAPPPPPAQNAQAPLTPVAEGAGAETGTSFTGGNSQENPDGSPEHEHQPAAIRSTTETGPVAVVQPPSPATPTQATTAPEPVAPTASAMRVMDPTTLVRNLDQLVMRSVQNEQTSMRIELEPVALGRVMLLCRQTGDGLSVQLTVQNQDIRSLLTGQEQDLRDNLAAQGFQLGQFSVSCRDGNGRRGDEHAQQRQGGREGSTGQGATLEVPAPAATTTLRPGMGRNNRWVA